VRQMHRSARYSGSMFGEDLAFIENIAALGLSKLAPGQTDID